MANQAVWIKGKHACLEVDEAEMPTPGDGEALVRVDVVALSPLESKLQKVV
ncbi:hypothetical protein ASPZODRAFT_20645 [Penicilliopsis zonata CBS 506.65]|uniref:Uncharacterized protein n=1 Tax=Penicilliopsis zonata CBS 506.65 TaxID=1073090 RepID=A0A1L9S522_9EURO|nr:hypothetical protein ASPZODRAFT_20645 [Penicilliopsis zonata CBS 506.65]OJJ42252.1 hypothetical protein ASPZODRAFT_20645 [Penicilliopsis zonata CBS 506.65]